MELFTPEVYSFFLTPVSEIMWVYGHYDGRRRHNAAIQKYDK
jgi:hypothetical protein